MNMISLRARAGNFGWSILKTHFFFGMFVFLSIWIFTPILINFHSFSPVFMNFDQFSLFQQSTHFHEFCTVLPIVINCHLPTMTTWLGECKLINFHPWSILGEWKLIKIDENTRWAEKMKLIKIDENMAGGIKIDQTRTKID